MKKSCYTERMSNAIDFISSYNVIDSRLRSLYRGKGNLQFTDLVRRCAEFNATVRRNEEELLSYARLRNAIVHNSTKERIIAEPCDEATEHIRRIAELLSAPPVLAALGEKKTRSISAETTIGEAMAEISRTGFSNLPVYRGGRMIGILNNRRLVCELGKAVDRGISLDEFTRAPCSELLADEDMSRYYRVMAKSDTVQAALDAFEENRKLLAIIVTEGENVYQILTAADLPRLMKLVEE
ncbi:MAG: CBS domain-containing protein [Candidatus Gallimonas sp.]